MKPPVLRKGDTVGILSPSSPPFERSSLEPICEALANLGLKWKLGKHLFDSYADLAGRDEDRLSDLHEFWGDPEVNAIVPFRGGNGAARLLPNLDMELIRANPKIIVGFSDITALLIAIHQKTGLITFHGSMARSFLDSKYSHDSFVRALMSSEPLGELSDPEPRSLFNREIPSARVVLSEGSARGPLTGGCFTLIKQLMGTPWELETKGKILFLEDVQEEPYSIDRALTQLDLAGKLKDAAGIIIGQCLRCGPGDSRRSVLPLNSSLETLLAERFANYGKPVVYGMRIGHTNDRLTLPIGIEATLTADSKGVVLRIEESATIGGDHPNPTPNPVPI